MTVSTLRVSKIGALRKLLFDLLQEHERDGTIPTNARFLFYELVQRGHLSKERAHAGDGFRAGLMGTNHARLP